MVKGMLVCLISMKKDFFFWRNVIIYTTNLLLIFLFFWEEENIIEQFLNFNTIITLFYNCCVRGINDKCVQWVNRIRFIRTLWTIRWKCSFKYEIRIFDGELLNAVTFIQHITISDFIIAPKRTKLPINRRNETLLRSPPPRKIYSNRFVNNTMKIIAKYDSNPTIIYMNTWIRFSRIFKEWYLR